MCLLMMLWGIMLFGDLLAELAEINHAANLTGIEGSGLGGARSRLEE